MNQKLPDLLGKLSQQTQIYKHLCIVLGLSVVIQSVVLVMLAQKPVRVITFDPLGNYVSPIKPKREALIEQAIRAYVKRRYEWNPKTIDAALIDAESFIVNANLKSFRSSLGEVIAFAKERSVSQRVFVEKVIVSEKSVEITGEKVSTVQDFKAVTTFHVRFRIEDGPHTKANPWGIYIASEQEEVHG